MNSKNCIRIVVLLALLAWPAVESYRLYEAKQDLAARLALETKVTQKLVMSKQKQQVARIDDNR